MERHMLRWEERKYIRYIGIDNRRDRVVCRKTWQKVRYEGKRHTTAYNEDQNIKFYNMYIVL